MKRKSLIYVLLSLFICSCTNDIDTTVENCNVPNNHAPNTDGKFKIDEVKALSIANNFFKSSTRGSSDFVMDYVKSSEPNLTRGGDFVYDTLAYILNRGDGEGFIVVSSDNRVFPVLAYSETGTFSYKESMEDPVYANFISRLDGYLKSAENKDSVIEVPDDYLLRCVIHREVVDSSWHQLSPYNKYVVKYNPNCPVGCVAIATAQAMLHCKDEVVYGDRTYDFKEIREVLSENRLPGESSLTMDYDTAMDKIAYLLYQIGMSTKMIYHPIHGSGTTLEKAMSLLDSLNYNVRNQRKIDFVDSIVVNYLLNDDIICIGGTGIVNGGEIKHAWIIDGCSFCWKENRPKSGVQYIFLHCNWGWGGKSNGYYSPLIYFDPEGCLFYTYQLTYFSVGKKSILESLICEDLWGGFTGPGQ